MKTNKKMIDEWLETHLQFGKKKKKEINKKYMKIAFHKSVHIE